MAINLFNSDPKKLTVSYNPATKQINTPNPTPTVRGNVGSVASGSFVPAKSPVVASNVGATAPQPTTIQPSQSSASLQTPQAKEYINGLLVDIPSQGSTSSMADRERKFDEAVIPTTFAPPVPLQKSPTDTAFENYIKSLRPSESVTSARTAYNDYVANQSKSVGGLEGQGRGIPLSLVRGQQEKLLKQTQPEALRLQNEIAIQQDADTQRMNASKAEFDYLSGREKPLEVGGALIKLNPQTGKYETVYQPTETPEGFTLSEGQIRYDAQGNPIAQGLPKPTTNELGALGLTPAQANQFNSIVAKYNASPLVAAADRTVVLKNAVDQIKQNPNNGPLQLNLVYSYIQALDTYQSAVREGELGLVNSIDSKIGQLQNSVSKIQQGQIVRPEVALDIANAASKVIDTISQGAKAKAQSFQSQANVIGLGDAWNQYLGGFQQSFDNNIQPTDNDPLGLGFNQGGSVPNNAQPTSYKSITLGSNLARVNNNPGNLRFVGQAGATQGSGGFAKFATPQAGVQALQNQIKLDASRNLSLAQFINKYAPPVENNTSLYLQQAIKSLGVPANTPLKNIDLDKITKFMALKESSSKIG